MPAFHISRSIQIDAEPEQVFDTVVDFNTWQLWSPWLCADKDAKVTVSDNSNSVGSNYHWDGDVVGAGELEHLSLQRPTRIDDEIRFLKPWKSVSKVGFQLERIGNQTKLIWYMDGKLPWFMFWMKGMMEAYVGMDYQRGLSMLKEHIETGSVLSDTEVLGVVDVPTRTVDGIRGSAKISDIGDQMSDVFHRAQQAMGSSLSEDCEVVGIYHRLNMKTTQMDFTGGFTTKALEPPNGAAGLKRTVLPAGKALHVRHTGSYANVGNAWSSAHQVARYKKIKLHSKQPGYEIYRNNPEDTPAEELVTDIFIPVKG